MSGSYQAAEGHFRLEEHPEHGGELPHYAALTTRLHHTASHTKYGESIVFWKDHVRARTTYTPSDSYDTGNIGHRSYTSARHPITLLAYAADPLVDLALAEVSDPARAAELTRQHAADGLDSSEHDIYVEAQIHGGLS
ncbi:hypothetical protein GCM10011581_02940 [Saccharopolyspora subtropica]|uniref:Uncharacterized protein n=1 Tax=Saccharopolyspora thermophila TaxID=89367 RepID=A0A917JK99_9PSEU|nr:hypothetical protein [Saccharopolyspora subtropica]GGI69366.1 hypothetical protein GCM10011581_02940 [Saccharopolyspora subtropica]